MTMKYTALVLLAYISVGWASIAYAPITKTVVDTEYDHNPQYTYSYGVEDVLTGDSKSQTETRTGDIVTGQYSLIEPDGSKRIVDYTADPINGFNALVRKAAPAVTLAYTAPAVAKVPSLAYASPVISKVAAPSVAYTTPVISKLAVPLTAGLNSLSYASAPITKTVIQGPTVNYASPLVYSANLGKGFVTAHSALYPYADYSHLYTNPLTYAKVHY